MNRFQKARRIALALGLLFAAAGCSDGSHTSSEGGANPSPLSFSLPQQGAELAAPTALTVSGTGILEVGFFVDGEEMFVDGEEPFSWELDPAALASGTHRVRVTATTESGVRSQETDVAIAPGTEPPPLPPTTPDENESIFERATPEQIGIYIPADSSAFASKPPSDAVAKVRYRKVAESTWRDAHPLLRIHPEWNSGGAPVTPVDAFAGTIFGLDPGTSYAVEVEISAPSFETVTIEGVRTTRALPAATGTANKTASTSDDLQDIVDGLEPGDVLELAAGTYAVSPLSIRVSGTAAAPITIRGVSRESVILSRSSGAVVQLTQASHIVLENLTLKGSGSDSGTAASSGAISFWDGALQEFVTIRGIDAAGVDTGIVASATTRSILVYDCELHGNNEWNATFLHSNLTWNDDGIRLPGEGNCVFRNTLDGFGDSLAVNDGVFSAAVYFYRNRIAMTGDDAWEADYGTRNLAFYDNHVSNCSTLMSCDPVWGGPIYCFRNVAVNTIRGPFKFNSTQSGMLVYCNTIVRTDGTTDWGWVQFNNGALRGWAYRNNLLVYFGGTKVMALESGAMDPIDFTHNGWYPDGSFWWSNSGGSATSLDGVRSALSATTPLFSASTKRHDQDVLLGSQPFSTTIPLGSDHLTQITSVFVPVLGSGSAASHAGVAIPNVTDGYSGSAPDMGAVIGGRSNPDWGADR